ALRGRIPSPSGTFQPNISAAGIDSRIAQPCPRRLSAGNKELALGRGPVLLERQSAIANARDNAPARHFFGQPCRVGFRTSLSYVDHLFQKHPHATSYVQKPLPSYGANFRLRQRRPPAPVLVRCDTGFSALATAGQNAGATKIVLQSTCQLNQRDS